MEQKILLNSPLFTGITPEEAQTMLSCLCAKERSVPADHYLLREGDTVTRIGLLLEGEVQIAQTDYWGNTNILNMLAPGDVFGEIYACRPTEPIRFYVQAKCPCRVLFLDIDRVIHTCTNACIFHERLVRNLLFTVAGKALELAKKTSYLSHRSTREKLLAYLCDCLLYTSRRRADDREGTAVKTFVLSSSSPRRRELFSLVVPRYEVVPARVDERALTAPTPLELAQVLGRAKCAEVAQRRPGDVVVGCDTVVECEGEALGKPADRGQAAEMLRRFSGAVHRVHTGVAIRCGGEEHFFTETSRVSFAPLTEEEIAAYTATEEPYDKAGGYAIQGGAAKFITRIEGCYFNIMGLPVSRLYQCLKSLGYL